MAEDNGGILAVGLSGDVAASIRAQADAQARAAALRVEYDDLKGYKALVDGLLTKLQESPAHHGKLADGTMPAGVLGTGFPEADKLYEAYKTVHSELQKLSKGLAEQIEGLGIAVQSASGGYAVVDEEQKRRMVVIAKQAHDEYVRDRDPYAKKQSDSTQPNGKNGGVL
ncbi:hypothetical protein [Streptomyces yangpuensis]|uniref:Excreted virulence factor EspC, type VII ESX diderm n=1 Tax=Streptomyces yangpuensis TaxID=1648182 RepID=A0ABY5PWC4_9ACTN|nr:hypothetical protein [Streptomyces yangpuensis]UUY48058.1 hypothetical protein NRK68_13030 [Streptomyces yangpuensis]